MVVRIGQRGARPRKTYFKEWRLFRGLTQEQLAERIGTTKAGVSKIETGRTLYNQSSLEAWAVALSCEPSDLISRDPTQEDVRSLLERAPDDVRSAVVLLLRTGTGG